MEYYIETLRKGYLLGEDPEIIKIPGGAKEAFCEYLRLISAREYGHLTLRQKAGNFHGLISEWFCSDGDAPFWYWGHTFSYQPFCSALGFDPRKVNTTKRV